MNKRPVQVVVLAALSLLVLGPVPKSLAGPPDREVPVGRLVPKVIDFPDASAAYATGTVLHAEAVRSGAHPLVGLDVAFSGATWSSEAMESELANEVRRQVAPKLDPNHSFGRGAGLELGVAYEPQPIIGQLSQAAAPPSTTLVRRVVGPIDLSDVRAELLRSEAQARAAEKGCVLGPDQAYGFGSVLDLEVLGGLIATRADPPMRRVAQSSSTTRIVPGSEPGRLGLQSETRQAFAPVTFFEGTPSQFTVEILGEWALRAVADGLQGDVHYGPVERDYAIPILRILGSEGEVLEQLTSQMLFDHGGLEINVQGIAEIVVGENPRGIGGDSATTGLEEGSLAAAAVDVVRVKLLQSQLADVRIGHMEAAVTVPAGGVRCPGITVEQETDRPSVGPGGDFLYKITVTNPNDCVMDAVRLVVNVDGDTPGATHSVVAAEPSPATTNPSTATFEDVGPLGEDDSRTVAVKVSVPPDSLGQLASLVEAESVCPAVLQPSSMAGDPPDGITVTGRDKHEGPLVGTCVVPNITGADLAQAQKALEEAGCKLGNVTIQGPDPGEAVPIGTEVKVRTRNRSGFSLTQGGGIPEKAATTAGPTPESGDRPPEPRSGQAAPVVPPALARTGGVALGGLALGLLTTGLLARTAGSRRLWRRIRPAKI